MYLKELLREEIESELEGLKDMEAGTEEYKTAVEGIAKLTDRVIEMEKLENEEHKQLKDEEVAENNRKEEQKDRLLKNCISIAGIVIPSLITIWGTLKSFEFEKEGTVTTIMGRGFINKLLPKK